MNTSKSKTFVILLLVLAVIGIGTYAWRQQDELNGLRTSKVSEKDMAALRARAFEAEKRIKELEAALALAKAAPPADAAPANGRGNRGGNNVAANGGPQQGGPGQGGPGGRGNQLQAIMNNPQAIALQATAEKANLSVQFAAFFRNSGLTGEQADAVTTLLANRQNVMQDLMAAAAASGMQADPQSLQSLVAEQQAQIDSQLKAAMGDTAYAQYQNYQSTLTRRQEVASYQQQLTMAGVPLDANQAEALIAALGPSTNAGGGGGRGGAGGIGGAAAFGGGGGRGGGGVTNISANNITAAASVLNPTQLQVLQATQQAQQANQSLNQITGGGRGAPQRGAATATTPATATGAAATPATTATRGAAAGATRATRGN